MPSGHVRIREEKPELDARIDGRATLLFAYALRAKEAVTAELGLEHGGAINARPLGVGKGKCSSNVRFRLKVG